MISLGEAAGNYDKNTAKSIRRAFIDAHANHVAFKLKRSSENNRDTSGE